MRRKNRIVAKMEKRMFPVGIPQLTAQVQVLQTANDILSIKATKKANNCWFMFKVDTRFEVERRNRDTVRQSAERFGVFKITRLFLFSDANR